jgi:uncharacterized protein (DUF934 family)
MSDLPTPDRRPTKRIIRRDSSTLVRIVEDDWDLLDPDAPLRPGNVIMPWERYSRESDDLALHDGRVGLQVPAGTPVDALESLVDEVDLIALEFPKFTEGRPFSLARRLRERFGYAGPLRAIGDVLPDQLHYMDRCGFDEFDLKPGKSLEVGLRCLEGFSFAYQGSAEDPRPLFRLRGGAKRSLARRGA